MNQAPRAHRLSASVLSIHVADLLLAGAGETESIRHAHTRRAWHWFFGAIVLFLVWYLASRLVIIPSFDGDLEVYRLIRASEAFVYLVLLWFLGALALSHYRFILRLMRSLRFITLAFFFASAVFLFARFHYSVFHVRPDWFRLAEGTVTPSPAFGIAGMRDLAAFGEFLVFSGCTMLNCSLSNIAPRSLTISLVAFLQLLVGVVFVAIVFATFVEHTAFASQGADPPHTSRKRRTPGERPEA